MLQWDTFPSTSTYALLLRFNGLNKTEATFLAKNEIHITHFYSLLIFTSTDQYTLSKNFYKLNFTSYN